MTDERIGDCVWLVEERGSSEDEWYWVEVCNTEMRATRAYNRYVRSDPFGRYRIAHFTLVVEERMGEG